MSRRYASPSTRVSPSVSGRAWEVRSPPWRTASSPSQAVPYPRMRPRPKRSRPWPEGRNLVAKASPSARLDRATEARLLCRRASTLRSAASACQHGATRLVSTLGLTPFACRHALALRASLSAVGIEYGRGELARAATLVSSVLHECRIPRRRESAAPEPPRVRPEATEPDYMLLQSVKKSKSVAATSCGLSSIAK